MEDSTIAMFFNSLLDLILVVGIVILAMAAVALLVRFVIRTNFKKNSGDH